MVDVAALRLAHLNEVLDEEFAIIFADAPGLVQALVGVECQFFLGRLELLGLVLEHVSESSLLTRGELVLHFLDVGDAALANVAPLCIVFLSE